MTDAILKITDGTTTVDLLKIPGLLLNSWRPTIPPFKGDGTFQSSPLADGRQLVDKHFENTIEQISYKAQDLSQDDVITRMQDALRLLEKAVQYWATDWQDEVVWLEAKAKCETNTRYGHIMSYRIPELENPYDQPFLQPQEKAVMDDLTLIIEHTTWTENIPGVGTAVELSAVETYDSRNLGNVDSSGNRQTKTGKEVFLYNSSQNSNLTHIFIDDGGVFSANLMDAALPYNLLPAVPVANDAIYFGIEESSPTGLTGQLTSLVFDIGVAGSGYTGVWEYWDFIGVAWSAATAFTQDNTNASGAGSGIAFDTAGVGSVHFDFNGINNNQTAVNGVTAWWVRYKITGTPGAITVPTQQNRDVYNISWNYTEVQSSDVLGDIQALMQFKLYDRADKDGSGGSDPDAFSDRIISGLRSVDRGSTFRTTLNCTNNSSNPTGVTVAVGANTVFANSIDQPSAGVATYTPVGVEAIADRVIFTLSASLMREYYGLFHVFGRFFTINSSVYTVRLRVTVGSGGIDSFSNSITLPASLGSTLVFDLGKIDIPAGKLKNSEEGDQTEIALQAGASSATGLLTFLDVVLIPVDEWSGDCFFSENNNDAILQRNRYLNVDSVTFPKGNIRSIIFNESNDRAVSFYTTIANGKSMLQANKRQRLWFLTMKAIFSGGSFSHYESNTMSGYTIQMFKNQQYTSMRGNR